MTATVTIHTHLQLGITEREKRDPAWQRKTGWANKSGQTRTHRQGHSRTWANSARDRHNGGYKFFGPGWLLPQVAATVTGSIVWGICGSMADMPEY